VEVTVTDADSPIDVPLPSDFKPVEEVEITVTTTREGTEQPTPTNVEVVIKGCLHGKYSEITRQQLPNNISLDGSIVILACLQSPQPPQPPQAQQDPQQVPLVLQLLHRSHQQLALSQPLP
jgi:hypothetical protein